MTNYYKSKFYDFPIEVDNIKGELLVTITDKKGRKIIYSWYDLIAKNTESKYITKCLLGGIFKKIPQNVLIIGFGGGAFAKYLEDHIKDIKITGIDIDETMFEIAKTEFNIKTKDLLLMDGEEAIEEIIEQGQKYDLILLDVYGSEGTIPDNFNKKIPYKNIKKILHSNGIFSINYADYTGLNIGKYNKIHNYLKEIFSENYVHILGEKNNKGNVSGIYNLEKKYSADEITIKYLEKVKNGEILYDPNMVKNNILDEK